MVKVRIDLYIEEFKEKLIHPLFEDIRRTLEITYFQKHGPDNHSSNFVGNLIVLMALETIAQFINHKTNEDLVEFEKVAKLKYKSLKKSELKKFLSPKNAPNGATGSELAKKFIKNYFDERFINEKASNGQMLVDIVWEFRNPHAHAFYPFCLIKDGLKGAVDWLYDKNHPDKKHGITIKDLELDFEIYNKSLYREDNDKFFRLCPQILFVYLKKGLEKYLDKVYNNGNTQRIFCNNYERLSERYDFCLNFRSKFISQKGMRSSQEAKVYARPEDVMD